MDGEKIVGDAFIYNWMGEKDYVKLMNFAIHPDYRRQGICKTAAGACDRGDVRARHEALLRRNARL